MLPPTKKYKKHSDFKVLFLYPNLVMSALAPQGIGYLSAILKQEDFTVELFDTTFYTSDLSSNVNDEKVLMSKVRPFDWEEGNIRPKTSDMLEDFKKKVDDFCYSVKAIGKFLDEDGKKKVGVYIVLDKPEQLNQPSFFKALEEIIEMSEKTNRFLIKTF